MLNVKQAQTTDNIKIVKITQKVLSADDWRGKRARGLEWEKTVISNKQKKHQLSNQKIAVDQETTECMERIKEHSGYYKIRKYRRGKPGQYVMLGLDRNVWIKMQVFSGELVCSYDTV